MSIVARAAVLKQTSLRAIPSNLNAVMQRRAAHIENTLYNVSNRLLLIPDGEDVDLRLDLSFTEFSFPV